MPELSLKILSFRPREPVTGARALLSFNLSLVSRSSDSVNAWGDSLTAILSVEYLPHAGHWSVSLEETCESLLLRTGMESLAEH